MWIIFWRIKVKKHEKSAVFDFILITILLLFAGFIAFMNIDNSVYRIRDRRNLEDFSNAWYTGDNKEISLTDLGKCATKNNDGKLEIYVYHTIPAYLVNDTILNFRSKNIRFQVIVNNEVIYDFMPEIQSVLSKGNGSCFHRVNIKRENAGGKVGLRIFPIYNDSGSRINNIYLGRAWDYFGKMLDQNFFGFQFSFMIVLIGIILILISLFFKLGVGYNERNRVLGMLTVSVGVWAASETLLLQFMFGHSSQLNEINHLLLIFMPYFFVSYVYQDLEYSRDIFLKASFGITVLELIVISVLSLAGIKDSHESIYIIHICFLIIAAISMVAVVENILYCKKNKIKSNTLTVVLSIGVFAVSSVWDIFSYYLDYGGKDNGTIMRFGILIGVLILVVDSMRKLFDGIKKAEITDKVTEMSYTDSLTGLANRTAFEEKEKEIQEKLNSGEIKSVLICQFDLNDLRKINDNYGHAYGDRHIIKCAEIIDQAFGNSGSAFRVGGDEFIVFVIGDGTDYIYERGILKLKELEREYNRTPDLLMPLHIAYGHAVYDKNEFENLEKAEMEADKRMYECKDRMKKGAIV